MNKVAVGEPAEVAGCFRSVRGYLLPVDIGLCYRASHEYYRRLCEAVPPVQLRPRRHRETPHGIQDENRLGHEIAQHVTAATLSTHSSFAGSQFVGWARMAPDYLFGKFVE
jgi:hypothetical protein